MIIHLNLNKVDEAKMREVMKRDHKQYSQAELKRWFLEQLINLITTNYSALFFSFSTKFIVMGYF